MARAIRSRRHHLQMRFDRAAAGLTFAGILVAIAFAPAGPKWMTYVLLTLALAVAVVAFAPLLPVLNRLPRIGAPRVSTHISSEPVPGVPNHVVLRIGFVNAGPRRVEGVLMNVLVPESVDIRASDHDGQHVERGSAMPPTVLDGRPTCPSRGRAWRTAR